jgi:hypothetical protein
MTHIDAKGNIIHTRGDSFSITIYDILIDGVQPPSWLNWKVSFQVKINPKAETKIIDLNETDGIDLSVPGMFIITKKDMNNIPVQNYVFEIQVTDPNGFISTWLQNKSFVVTEDVIK